MQPGALLLALVGTGTLPAGTVDFLGDTLGSFSSMQIESGSWRRVGDAYEGTLWTLPDRGRNDPAANLFYDYAARLHRFRITFTPADGHVTLAPNGGLRLSDLRGQPFTGADPGDGTLVQRGITLPAPTRGVGAGHVSLDAESLQFTRDGGFYIGDEYAANVYRFDRQGHLQGILQPPPAVQPRTAARADFQSLKPPQTGRRNNQGVEGLSLSPDGGTLFVALQSALVQDTAQGNASGRSRTRVLVYDVRRDATPAHPVAHYVIDLPTYRERGGDGPPDHTAAQSELRALDDHQFLLLSRDAAGVGASGDLAPVYKRVLLADVRGATNLAGTEYERGTTSVLRADIRPIAWTSLVDLLDPAQLARVGLRPQDLSEKWEAMDLVPALDPRHPDEAFLLVGNDNDFIARHCVMQGQACDSDLDNDNRVLVYRLSVPIRRPQRE